MIYKRVEAKTEKIYTEFCNFSEKTKVFKACGNCDNRWVITQFKDEAEFEKWSTVNQVELRGIFN